MTKIDFDALAKLAQDDPEEFERTKDHLIETAILEMTPNEDTRTRLRAMIHKTNTELDLKFKDPVARFNEVQRKFWMQVHSFKNCLECPPEPKKKEDNVVDFRKPDIDA